MDEQEQAGSPAEDAAPDGQQAAASAFVDEVLAACKARKPYTLVLEVPIEFGRQSIDSLTFKRPTAALLDQWQLGEKRHAAYLELAARLCSMDVAALRKLDIDDANKAVLIAGFFSGQGLPTGGS